MNTLEPVVIGRGRYRLHRLRNGLHICYQVEWQRNRLALSRRRVRCNDGRVVTFLSPPPWESSAQLFADADEAAAFAETMLDAEHLTPSGREPGSTC